jgi:hypothetical protein
MGNPGNISKERTRGQSSVEIAFMAPWLFFLFVGVVDLGFWSYQMICLENAVRIVGLYASENGTANTPRMKQLACSELDRVINIPSGASCHSSSLVQVSVLPSIAAAGNAPERFRLSLQVRMTPMIPIPGLLTTSNITRLVEVPSLI